MTGRAHRHETNLDILTAPPAELDAGAGIELQVRSSCAVGCDLQGTTIQILSQDGAVGKKMRLATVDGLGSETGKFVVKAPTQPGRYEWMAVFPEQEKDGVLHDRSSAAFSFNVKRHPTKIVIWGLPAPIICNTKFGFKVGVECPLGCRLAGNKIGIYDQEGIQVAVETLGDAPWPTLSSLYWAEVALDAPVEEGFYRWTAKFGTPDLELVHEEALCPFGFAASRQPERVVTVDVLDNKNRTPIRNAVVFLSAYSGYPYRGWTDDYGTAKVSVSRDKYELTVEAKGYRLFETVMEVADDTTVKAELVFAPGAAC